MRFFGNFLSNFNFPFKYSGEIEYSALILIFFLLNVQKSPEKFPENFDFIRYRKDNSEKFRTSGSRIFASKLFEGIAYRRRSGENAIGIVYVAEVPEIQIAKYANDNILFFKVRNNLSS